MRRALVLTAPLAVLALLTACSGGADATADVTDLVTTAAGDAAPDEESEAVALDETGLAALQLTAAELGEGWTALDMSGAEDTDAASLLPDGAVYEPAACGEQVLALQEGTAAEPDAQSIAAYTQEDGTFVGVTLSTGEDYNATAFDALATAQTECATYTVTIPEMFSASYSMTALDTATLGDRSQAVVIATSLDGQPAGSTAMLLSQVGDVVVTVMTSGLTDADTALLERAATQAVEKVAAGA
ncbi:hypothetical protein ACTHAM_001782 [Cellulomonas soli]|uniref:hypothetical protein n=1 Tax=Cellulomonas soli TaxID=931535 RepID=UPI003F842EAB